MKCYFCPEDIDINNCAILLSPKYRNIDIDDSIHMVNKFMCCGNCFSQMVFNHTNLKQHNNSK